MFPLVVLLVQFIQKEVKDGLILTRKSITKALKD